MYCDTINPMGEWYMSRRMFAGIALVVLLAFIASVGQFASLQARPDDKPFFTRLIGPQTLVFQHARIADLLSLPFMEELNKQMPEMKEQMFKGFQKELGIPLSDLESLTLYLDQPRIAGGDLEEPRPPYFLFQTKKPIDAAAVKATAGENAKSIQFGKYELTMGNMRGMCLLDDRTVLVITFGGRFNMGSAQKDLLMLFTGLEAGSQVPEGLKAGVDAALKNKHYAVTGFQIPKELSDLMQEQLKNLLATFTPFKPLAQIQSGVLTVDYIKGAENDFQIKLLGRYVDAGSAKAAQNALRFAVAAGKMAMTSMPNRNDPEMKTVYDFVTKQLDQIKFETSDRDVVADYQINMGKMMPIFLAAIEKVRNAADRMLSGSNMRQCLIAMHNYHDAFNKLPEAMTMKNNKPMHSWRVLLLPYLEHDNIYKQVNFSEPWDSEANKKLFESIPMPKIYEHPGKKDGKSKMTYYKVFYSKSGVTPQAGFVLGQPMSLAKMVDGTSNTIAMIEAGPPVLWYKPEDIEFDPKAQLPKLTSPWKNDQVSIGFFDGSVRTVWLGTDEDTWKGLITSNGAEVVDASKLEEKK